MADARDAAPPPLIVFAHKGHDWIRGSEQCLLDLVAGLDRTRWRALVVANGRALVRESEQLGVEAVRLAHWGGGRVLGAPWREAMRRLLAARHPALVHANMAVALPMVMPAAQALGVPVLTHLHLPFASLAARHQALVRQSSRIVGVAEHVVAPLRAEPAIRDRLRVVGNCVNPARLAWEPGESIQRETLGIAATALVVTSLGSLIARKAHDVTIRGIAAARARGLDVHLLLCGDGDQERELRVLAAALVVSPFVHFLGVRSDVGALLASSALLVTSAREEAMPLSVIEAEWIGIAVLASDIAAHRELLGERYGVLFPVGDADALAESLIQLAAQPERRGAIGAAARAHARAEYGVARYVSAFSALYDELIRESHR